MMIHFLLLLLPAVFAAPSTPLCHAPDYNSYFVAQNEKSNLKSVNAKVLADLKPNFGSRYLLLRSELLMENLWLVVDCKTGKFFHEKISGQDLVFRPDSLSVTLKQKNSPDENYTWSGEEWTKVDPSVNSTAVSSPAPSSKKGASTKSAPASSPLQARYESLFPKYTTPPKKGLNCKPLDYDSYFRAQSEKDSIRKLNSDLGHPNFAGKYLLLKSETLFQTLWLLADCETGKFLPELLTGHAVFRADSALVILKKSGSFPDLKLWKDDQWNSVADSIQTSAGSVTNTFTGRSAKLLWDALPLEHKTGTLRFETIQCENEHCRVRLFPDQEKTFDSAALAQWIQVFGNRIESGSCDAASSKPRCQVSFR